MRMLQVGEMAPLFSAPSTQGPVRLADYVGRSCVVLIFYPKDDTPVCTRQLCAAQAAMAEFQRRGAAVIGINPGTLESHQAFAAKRGLDFPIVSDRDQSIREAYRVGKIWGLFGQQRIVYIIDRDGRIAWARKGNPSVAELLEVLSACGLRQA